MYIHVYEFKFTISDFGFPFLFFLSRVSYCTYESVPSATHIVGFTLAKTRPYLYITISRGCRLAAGGPSAAGRPSDGRPSRRPSRRLMDGRDARPWDGRP